MPLRTKLTPAALPVLTTISWLARMEVCAGAMRVSSATGLASATMEIQVVFSARMSRVKVGGGFTAAAEVFASGGLAVVAGWFAAGLFAPEPVADAGGDEVVLEDGDALGGVGAGLSEGVSAEGVSAETVPEDIVSVGVVPTDKVPGEDGFPVVSELGDAAREVDVGAGTGSGAEAEDFCAEAGGSDAALGSA